MHRCCYRSIAPTHESSGSVFNDDREKVSQRDTKRQEKEEEEEDGKSGDPGIAQSRDMFVLVD